MKRSFVKHTSFICFYFLLSTCLHGFFFWDKEESIEAKSKGGNSLVINNQLKFPINYIAYYKKNKHFSKEHTFVLLKAGEVPSHSLEIIEASKGLVGGKECPFTLSLNPEYKPQTFYFLGKETDKWYVFEPKQKKHGKQLKIRITFNWDKLEKRWVISFMPQ